MIGFRSVLSSECNRQTPLRLKIRFVSNRNLVPSDRATCMITSRVNFFDTKLSVDVDLTKSPTLLEGKALESLCCAYLSTMTSDPSIVHIDYFCQFFWVGLFPPLCGTRCELLIKSSLVSNKLLRQYSDKSAETKKFVTMKILTSDVASYCTNRRGLFTRI